MQHAIAKGQTVTFLCSSYLDDGTCLDGEDENLPIIMQAGRPGPNPFATAISNLLIGMTLSDTRTNDLKPEQAFGFYDRKKVLQIPVKNLSGSTTLTLGMEVRIPPPGKGRLGAQRSAVIGTVVGLDQYFASIDTNHPFAGRSITVKITVVSVS